MSDHTTRAASLIAAVLAGASTIVFAAGSVAATTTLDPATAFEIDGNATVDLNGGTPSAALAGDWDGLYGAGTSPGGFPTTGVYYYQRNDDPCASPTDDIGVGGDKAADGPVWPSAIGQPNIKTDLAAISFAAEKIATGGPQLQDVLYASFERCGGGSGAMSTLIAIDDGDGVPASAGDDGDFLFRFDFDPNSGISTVTMMLRTAGVWADTPIPTGSVESAVAPAPGNFGEVAINLTRLGIIDETVCGSVTVSGQGSTITGGDLQSQPKDIVPLEPFTISNCGAVEVTKQAVPVTTGDRFTYVIDQGDGAPVHDGTLAVAGGASTAEPDADVAEIDATIAAGETHLLTNVISQPDYRIAETALPAGWTLDSIVCTYSDIFQPLPNETEVVVYSDGAPTGDVFQIPPSSFANQAVPATHCTIVNSAAAVVVTKAGTGDAAQRFDFTVTGHDPIALAIGESTDPLFADSSVPVTIAEVLPSSDWSLASIVCVDDSQNVVLQVDAPSTPSVTFDAVPGGLVVCTFDNVQAVPTTTTTTTTTTEPPVTTTTTTEAPATTTSTTTTTTTTIVAALPPQTTAVEQVPTDILPPTGTDGAMAAVAFLLLALGSGLHVVARRGRGEPELHAD